MRQVGTIANLVAFYEEQEVVFIAACEDISLIYPIEINANKALKLGKKSLEIGKDLVNGNIKDINRINFSKNLYSRS